MGFVINDIDDYEMLNFNRFFIVNTTKKTKEELSQYEYLFSLKEIKNIKTIIISPLKIKPIINGENTYYRLIHRLCISILEDIA